MKRILILACCFFAFSLIDAKAQKTSYVAEKDVDVTEKMTALSSKKNGDYEIYRYRNGIVAVATVENGEITSVRIKAPDGTLIPTRHARSTNIGRCFLEWRNKDGRHRVQFPCPDFKY